MEQSQREKNLKLIHDKVLAPWLDSDTTLASSEFAPTQAITAGFEGVVKSIEYVEVKGRGVTTRNSQQGPQKVTVDGKDVIIAEEGETSRTLAIVFDNGKTISLSTLTQSKNSGIDMDNGDTIAFQKFTGKMFKALIGKKLECTYMGDDTQDTPIPRTRNGVQESRLRKKYEFKLHA